MIPPELAVAEKACRGKTRWYDVLFTGAVTTSISFTNNRQHTLTERTGAGIGVRVNRDGRTGFSYTGDLSRTAESVDRALALAPYGEADDFDLPGKIDLPAVTEPVDDFSVTAELARGTEVIARLTAALPGVLVDLRVTRSAGTTGLVNSAGFAGSYRATSYSATVSATRVFDDGTKLAAWESVSGTGTCDPLPLVDILVERVRSGERVVKVPPGKLPVLVTPKAAAGLVRILTAGLSARGVWKGTSPFHDRIGQQAFSSRFTLVDDPTLAGSPHGYPFDDEGVPASPTTCIDAGVIRSFIADLRYAARLGAAPTGNGLRGYSSLPSPGWSNIVVGPGDARFGDLVRGMDRGLVVDQFIGLGQSNTLTGDFSANLDLAYAVEKGEITGRVKDCMLADNLFSLLGEDIVLAADRARVGSVTVPAMLFPAVNFVNGG